MGQSSPPGRRDRTFLDSRVVTSSGLTPSSATHLPRVMRISSSCSGSWPRPGFGTRRSVVCSSFLSDFPGVARPGRRPRESGSEEAPVEFLSQTPRTHTPARPSAVDTAQSSSAPDGPGSPGTDAPASVGDRWKRSRTSRRFGSQTGAASTGATPGAPRPCPHRSLSGGCTSLPSLKFIQLTGKRPSDVYLWHIRAV